MGQVQAYYIDLDGKKQNIEISPTPDKCPSCGKGIKPDIFIGYESAHFLTNERKVYLVFRCPIENCRSVFLGYYKEWGQYPDTFILNSTGIRIFSEFQEFPEIIKKISPKFPIIYNQALIADENGLKEICGSGYRRALEFLIKDYLIRENRGDRQLINHIKQELLSHSINRISDSNIKIVAEKAAWLGNDESHYLRKWRNLDINNLKDLIKLTVSWIESTEQTKKYTNIMARKKKMPSKQ